MSPILDSSSAFVEVWLNGLYCALVLQALSMIIRSTRTSTPQKVWQSGIIIAPYIFSTIHMSTVWLLTRDAINNNELPTAGSNVLGSLMHPSAWTTGLSEGSFVLNTCLADSIVIWRCWTVWGRRWVVVVIPILCLITGIALSGITITGQINANLAHESTFAAEKTAQFIALGTTFFSMSIATSLTTALLIAARIISVQRVTRKAGIRTGNIYGPIIEIVVESATIYSMTLFAFVIILTQHHTATAQYLTENIHSQVAGMAPMLIIYRIVAKHDRPDTNWETAAAMSPIQFAPVAHESVVGGSTNTQDDGNFTMAIISGSRISTGQEKVASASFDV